MQAPLSCERELTGHSQCRMDKIPNTILNERSQTQTVSSLLMGKPRKAKMINGAALQNTNSLFQVWVIPCFTHRFILPLDSGVLSAFSLT